MKVVNQYKVASVAGALSILVAVVGGVMLHFSNQQIAIQANQKQTEKALETKDRIETVKNQSAFDKAQIDLGYIPFDQIEFPLWKDSQINPPPAELHTYADPTRRKSVKDAYKQCTGFLEPNGQYHSKYEYQGHPEIIFDPAACNADNIGTSTKGKPQP